MTVAAPQGTSNAPPGDWGLEASLDVEWAHALAPGANILLVEARSAGTDLYAAVDYARQQPNVSVISMSWGSPEFSSETSYDQYFTTPSNHIGETFLGATGDQVEPPGDYPAYSPNVVAVGGTLFPTTLDEQGDNPGETGWTSSGGGISQFENQPNFQAGVVIQSTSKRTTPDVSFDADGSVAVYDSYDNSGGSTWTTETGTSLATASWAALIATADQGTSLLNQGTLTDSAVTTALYNIDSTSASIGFNDISSGNNGNPAGSGYDLVTGLGSPKAAALVAALSGNVGVPIPSTPSGVLANYVIPPFQWSAVPGAVSYHLVVTDSGSNTTILDLNVVGATSYSPPASTFVPGHFYQWQVQANLLLAGQGALSAPVAFSLPALGVPGSTSPSGEIATTTPTFIWSAVFGAAYYNITIFDQANPNVVAQSASGITQTSYVPTTPLVSGHNYSWYVQAYILSGGVPYASAATNVTNFSVNAPGTPTLLTPVANAILTTGMPTFSWSSVPGVNGYYLTLIDLTTNTAILNDLETGIDSDAQPFTSLTLPAPLASGHRYEWSVGSSGGTGNPFSNFTVAVPGAGTLPAPVPIGPNGNVNTDQPTFSWSSVSGAAGYELYIFWGFNTTYDETIGGTEAKPITLVGQNSTSYTYPYSLNLETAYSWYVVAYDSASDVSLPSTLVDFAPSASSSAALVPTPLAPLGTETTYQPTFHNGPPRRIP